MIQQRTPEWLEMRKNYIGSSDAPIIFKGSEKEKSNLWEKKKGLRAEDPINSFMQRGIDLEDNARNWVNNQLGKFLLPDVLVSNEHKFMMSSIDGIQGNTAVEIKCPTMRTRLDEALTGYINYRDQIQMQHHMCVWDLDKIYYAIYFSDQDSHLFEYARDDKFIENMIEEEKKFYDSLIYDNPPLKKMRSLEFIRQECLYLDAKEKMRQAKEEMDSAVEEMKILSEDMPCQGRQLYLSKYMKKGNINYAKIPEISNVNLELYRKEPTLCWRISEKR